MILKQPSCSFLGRGSHCLKLTALRVLCIGFSHLRSEGKVDKLPVTTASVFFSLLIKVFIFVVRCVGTFPAL